MDGRVHGGGSPGEGTFISLDRTQIPDLSGGRELYRITGQACNGKLDPGEAFNDINANGVLDADEDAGFLFHYDVENRVAVNRTLPGDKHRMNIAFVASDADGPAVFQSEVILPYPDAPGDPVKKPGSATPSWPGSAPSPASGWPSRCWISGSWAAAWAAWWGRK